MVQTLTGAPDFDAAPAFSPSALLSPWLAFGAQITGDGELQALEHAVAAVSTELHAWGHDASALWWLQSGQSSCAVQALGELTQMDRSLRQALWHWQRAGGWLQDYGEQSKLHLYAPLLQQTLSQQQRLEQQMEHLRLKIVLFCQEWGLPLSAVPDLAGNGG